MKIANMNRIKLNKGKSRGAGTNKKKPRKTQKRKIPHVADCCDVGSESRMGYSDQISCSFLRRRSEFWGKLSLCDLARRPVSRGMLERESPHFTHQARGVNVQYLLLSFLSFVESNKIEKPAFLIFVTKRCRGPKRKNCCAHERHGSRKTFFWISVEEWKGVQALLSAGSLPLVKSSSNRLLATCLECDSIPRLMNQIKPRPVTRLGLYVIGRNRLFFVNTPPLIWGISIYWK